MICTSVQVQELSKNIFHFFLMIVSIQLSNYWFLVEDGFRVKKLIIVLIFVFFNTQKVPHRYHSIYVVLTGPIYFCNWMLTELLKCWVKSHIPLQKGCHSDYPVWFSSVCITYIKKKRSTHRRFMKVGKQEDYEEYSWLKKEALYMAWEGGGSL